MSVYRVEATVSGISVLGGSFDSNFADITRAQLSITADDGVRTYGLIARLDWHSYGAGPTYEWQTNFQPKIDGLFGSGPDAWHLDDLLDGLGATILITEADGQNGAAYLAGFTFAIEKDTVAETMRWVTPLGDLLIAWVDLPGAAVTDAPMLARDLGHQFDRANGVDASETAHWTNFYAKKDGLIFQGAALTTDDPGTWDPWLFDSGYGGSGSEAVSDDGQLATDYQTKYRFIAADGFIRAGSREVRPWALPLIVNRGLDIARSGEHCLLWEASIPSYMPYRVVWRRTEDGGRIWEEGTVYQDVAKVWTSPSASFWEGRVTVVWSDGSAIYEAFSITEGETWSVPTTLPYTGQNPRHVTEWTSGFTLYFFFQGADLYVVRTSDHGHSFLDAAPVLVATAIGSQQIDADWAFDGSIVVTYFVAGVWQQSRSWDMGVSWG